MDNGHEPATKADLAELKLEFKQDLQELRQELKQEGEMLRSEMQHIYDTLLERLDDRETKLLQPFYSFTQSNQMRLSAIETESDMVRKRIAVLEERVLELERKVNFPNQPPQ